MSTQPKFIFLEKMYNFKFFEEKNIFKKDTQRDSIP